MTTQTKSKPAYVLRYGTVHAAIWQEPSEHGVRYSVTLDRRYLKDGKWMGSRSFRREEILEAAQALSDAYRFIAQDLQGAIKAPAPDDSEQALAETA